MLFTHPLAWRYPPNPDRPPRTLASASIWLALALLFNLSPLVHAAVIDGRLASLQIAGLSPAFNPDIKQYSIARTSKCSVPVTATLADTTLKLYIASTLTASGATRNAWVCDGKTAIDIVVYKNWTELSRYTVNVVETAPTPPPPPPVSGKLSGLTVANLSPAFDPNVTQYKVPQPANCSISITATVPDPANPNLKLYIDSNPTASGGTVNAWVCDGKTKVDIVIYDVWTVVGQYTITPDGSAPPPPMPGSGSGSGSESGSGSTPPNSGSTQDPPPEPIPTGTPTPLPLPSPSPVDKATAVRFLEHATFGPTPADIAAVQASGPQYWMAQQYNLSASAMPAGLNAGQVGNRLFLNMANGPDQLRQRTIFALSQIFVVSADKNVNGEELIPWVELLSRNAFGNFRTLLKEVTLSPTMGKFLDLANSMKPSGSTSPNENYPREVMQLFTVGLKELNQDGSPKLDAQGQPISTYNQNTVKEFARALTGLTYPTAPGQTPRSNNWEYFVGFMEYRQANHDAGAKTLLKGTVLPAGQTVQQDLDAVVDNLFQHPNTPPFFATRAIRALVASNPSPAYIQRVADVFVDNGHGVRGDLWAVLQAVLTDPEALAAAPGAQSGHLKDPVSLVLSLGRAMGAQIADPGMFMYVLDNLGQRVLAPPSVFSYYSPLAPLPGFSGYFGPEFQIYSPGLAIQRANFVHQILNGEMGSAFVVDLSPFTALAGDPAALVEKVNQTLLYGRMSNELRQIVLNATQAAYSARDRALGALYLVALSSEFSVVAR